MKSIAAKSALFPPSRSLTLQPASRLPAAETAARPHSAAVAARFSGLALAAIPPDWDGGKYLKLAIGLSASRMIATHHDF
ncbi:hypothetical protein [Azorhizobium sp. AG788]|uniref:hypothetical protein n=1 Tax=Azorhizobium sp. AG788 TaxID=2183897 RepID=UPI00313A1B6A